MQTHFLDSKKLSKLLLLPGLCPRPHWGSLQRSPDPVVPLRGEEGKGKEKGKKQGGEGRKGWGSPPPKCVGSAS